jgi:hypothetical protein
MSENPTKRAVNCLNWSNTPRSPTNPTYAKNTRFLIITLGPTGSGKSSMAKYLINYAKKINNQAKNIAWTTKVLDDYVEESEDYKKEIDAVIAQNGDSAYLNSILDNLDGCTIYEEPWKTIAQSCLDAYFKVRGMKDSAGQNKVDMFNNAFHDALAAGNNIIYEITGRSMFTTLEALNAISFYTNDCEKYNYVILAGFNITDFYSLQNRNIDRFKYAFRQYAKNPGQEKPPRLPWIGCFNPNNKGLSFCTVLDDIQKNIINLITNCGHYVEGRDKMLMKYADDKCVYDDDSAPPNPRPDYNPNGLYIDLLFIFNNIYHELKLVAKVPISKRSINLVNFYLTPKVYPTKNELTKVIELLKLYGPIKNGENMFLDTCGTGLPEFKADNTPNILEDDIIEQPEAEAEQLVVGGQKKYKKTSKRKSSKKRKTMRKRKSLKKRKSMKKRK